MASTATSPDPAQTDHSSLTSEVEKRISQSSSPADNGESPDKLEKIASLAPSTTDHYEYISGAKLAAAVTSVTLVVFLMMLDTSIIGTAIPSITNEFHSLPDVGWYGASYLLASCALQPSTGKLYQYTSSKYTFLSFLGVFELGSLLCGVARSSKMLIVGRAVAGLGSSGLINGALTIVAACLPIQKRPLYIGVMMGFSQIGIVIAPIIGGAFTQYVTWRWCFYINLPAGAIVAAVLFFTQIPSRHTKLEGRSRVIATLKKMDLVGFAFFAPAAIQCLLALEWGGSHFAWGDSRIIGLFCGSGATLAVFLAWEYHVGDEAMIPFNMMRQHIVWCGCFFILFFFGALMNAAYYLPIYFQAIRGVTPTLSGVYLLPMIISQMITAVLSGALVSRLGYYLPWAIACGVITSIGSGLFSTFSITTSTAKWIGFEILAGAGRGAGFQMPIVAVQNNLPPAQIPVGMSTLVFFQTFGGALFLAVAETDFASSLLKALDELDPPVDTRGIIEAGATRFRAVVSSEDLPRVLLAYDRALKNTFYLGAGACVAMFFFAWGLGWKSVKNRKTVKPEA